jgi:sterol 24-C-methyltransferase
MVAMLKSDTKTQQVVVEEYFKHWDNQKAAEETETTREVRCMPALSITLHLVYNRPEE